VTEMTERHGLTPIGNTKRADSKRVFALMAAPITLLPLTATEAAMREKCLSKDRTNFGMEVSSQSPHFSRAINATLIATQCPLQTGLGLARVPPQLAATSGIDL
jgi:hypothetical protein